MKDDLIKRSDAIAEIRKARTPDVASHQYAELFINAVCRVPSADRPQGEWIYTNDPLRLDDEWACSRCGNISFMRTNFCDRCGAQMKGADDE